MSFKLTPVTSLLVLLSVVLLSADLGRADFEANDIDDSYSLRHGSTALCPDKVEFDAGLTGRLTITSGEVEVNNNGCSGDGEIELRDSPVDSPATTYINNNKNQFGDYLAGNVTGGIIGCGGVTFPANEQLIFLQPDDDVTITFSTLFGESNTDLEKQGKTYELEEDDKYVIIGKRCLYEETGFGDRICFPGHARVGGSEKTMSQLSVGDEVTVDAHGTVETVLGFTHTDRHAKARFVSLHTDVGILTATPGHYVEVAAAAAAVAEGAAGVTLRKMADIKEGARLVHVSGARPVVRKVTRAVHKGVWNPHTKSGSIVVDGFVASCYTEAVRPMAAHALLTPLRASLNSVVTQAWRLLNAACGLFQS